MRLRTVLGVTFAAVVLFASSAEAQHHRRPPTTTPTTTPTAAPASTTPPDAATPTAPPQTTSRDQEARMLFEAGRVAYAAGRFEDALGYFQHAYEMSERAVLLYNVASAADKLRRDAVALDAFRRYLEAMPTAANREEVASRIQLLEQVVANNPTPAVPNNAVPPMDDAGAHATTTTETTHESDVAASL